MVNYLEQPVNTDFEKIVIRNTHIITSDINKENILPDGTKRHVQFRFPEISRQ
jgi:hypothetical protein